MRIKQFLINPEIENLDTIKKFSILLLGCNGNKYINSFQKLAYLFFFCSKMDPKLNRSTIFMNSKAGPVSPMLYNLYLQYRLMKKTNAGLVLTNEGYALYHEYEQDEKAYEIVKTIREKYDVFSEDELKLILFTRYPDMFIETEDLKKSLKKTLSSLFEIAQKVDNNSHLHSLLMELI